MILIIILLCDIIGLNIVKENINMQKEYFPDGTLINDWFYKAEEPQKNNLGRQYVITNYSIFDDGKIYTKEFQALIDKVYKDGGGVIVVPEGTYITGALYFRQNVNLYIESGGTIKGSDDISDYNLCQTRIEGETCTYFDALINADGVDGFTMCGKGTIDGNGLRAWKAFWLRRGWNSECTNKDEQRPRLVYISNSKNITIAGLNLQNSHYWTNHLYNCKYVKFINCRIFSPKEPVPAPSTDAIDIDVCSDVLIKNCYLHVNDDSVVLKGGKGPWADKAPENGLNERIIIEDCTYGFCHGCLTCGSESIHNRNIILRRVSVESGYNLLWLKMRPDTPQLYEHILIENVKANVNCFININPWTQFYDLKDRMDIPISIAKNITIRKCECICDTYLDITPNDAQYKLADFHFKDLHITANHKGLCENCIDNFKTDNVIYEYRE